MRSPMILAVLLLLVSPCLAQPPWRLNDDGSTTVEAERPIQVVGRNGLEKRKVASRGEVLGAGWGSNTGDFAELFFRTPVVLKPARIRFHYARELPGDVWLDLILDSVPVGRIRMASTGGNGEKQTEYRDVSIDIGKLKAGYHRLYITVVADGQTSEPLPETKLTPDTIIDRIGNRADKTSVGHGKNIALYTGRGTRKRLFFATHELGNVFNATDGETIHWNPDHALLGGNSAVPKHSSEVFIDTVTFEAKEGPPAKPTRTDESKVIEQRQVCVTNDVWWRKTSPADFESALADLHQPAEANGTQLILATLAVYRERPDGSNPKDKQCEQFAELTRKVARAKKIPLVDLRSAFINYLKKNNVELRVNGAIEFSDTGILTGDGVHPNQKGNEIIADLMAEALVEADSG
jgi:hypothetical protein